MKLFKSEYGRSYFYVWYMGSREIEEISVSKAVRPLMRRLVNENVHRPPSKATVEINSKGMKLIQAIPMISREGRIKFRLAKFRTAADNITYSLRGDPPFDDIVAVVLLVFNPEMKSPIHMHCYRCDGPEVAELLNAKLQALIDRPRSGCLMDTFGICCSLGNFRFTKNKYSMSNSEQIHFTRYEPRNKSMSQVPRTRNESGQMNKRFKFENYELYSKFDNWRNSKRNNEMDNLVFPDYKYQYYNINPAKNWVNFQKQKIDDYQYGRDKKDFDTYGLTKMKGTELESRNNLGILRNINGVINELKTKLNYKESEDKKQNEWYSRAMQTDNKNWKLRAEPMRQSLTEMASWDFMKDLNTNAYKKEEITSRRRKSSSMDDIVHQNAQWDRENFLKTSRRFPHSDLIDAFGRSYEKSTNITALKGRGQRSLGTMNNFHSSFNFHNY